MVFATWGSVLPMIMSRRACAVLSAIGQGGRQGWSQEQTQHSARYGGKCRKDAMGERRVESGKVCAVGCDWSPELEDGGLAVGQLRR